MKYANGFKAEAIKLRKLGLSYKEIQAKIPVAKSTLSLWLKSVPLKLEHRQRLYTKRIDLLARGPQSQRERRAREVAEIIAKAKSDINLPLSDETYKFFGVALFWAEGTKSHDLVVTNSDPYLICFMVKWFDRVFGIDSKYLKASLNIYPQQDEYKIKQFWSDLTGIPIINFRKSFIKPLSTGYKKNNLYYGTIKVYVPKGTDLRHKIYGWLQAALQDMEVSVKFLERKWVDLREKPRPVNLIK